MSVDTSEPKTIDEIAVLFAVAGDGDAAIRDLELAIDRLKRAHKAEAQLARLDPLELSAAFQIRGEDLEDNLA